MWAAARCRASSGDALRSAPTISSSSSQRIYGQRAIQGGKMRGTPHADWGITTLLPQKTLEKTLPHRLGQGLSGPQNKGGDFTSPSKERVSVTVLRGALLRAGEGRPSPHSWWSQQPVWGVAKLDSPGCLIGKRFTHWFSEDKNQWGARKFKREIRKYLSSPWRRSGGPQPIIRMAALGTEGRTTAFRC